MPETTFIYGLSDPRTREIRYIGKADRPKIRFAAHIGAAKTNREKSYKSNWIRSLLSKGLRPVLEIIDEVKITEWQAAEAAYIAFFREEGCPMVNSAPGGEGFGAQEYHPMFGKPMPSETKAKIGAAQKGEKNHGFGKKRPPDVRARISASEKGRVFSVEHRAKISEAMRGENNWAFGKVGNRSGARHTQEAKAKMSAARKGERNPNYGKHFSPEHRAKISASQSGKSKPLSQRLKVSAGLKRFHSKQQTLNNQNQMELCLT